jgi:hypothetical protein
MTTNEELVSKAVSGDMAPLLDRLRSTPIPTSGIPAGNTAQDMEPPDDDLWFKVLGAYMDGELSDDQVDELQDAAVEGQGKSA